MDESDPPQMLLVAELIMQFSMMQEIFTILL